MSKRLLSHSEISTAYDCMAKHSYAYTGTLTGGDALKPKRVHVNLREGRAWGAGIAAWHYTGDKSAAHAAMAKSLAADAEELQLVGFYDAQEHHATKNKLAAILEHEIGVSGRLDMVELEAHLLVPVRTAKGRRSTKFQFEGYLDGVHQDGMGRSWIVEWKLRKRLSSLDQIAKMPQIRRYAWAYQEMTGTTPAGVIVDERLNAAPADVKHNKDGSISKVQSCTPLAYVTACGQLDQEPDEEVLATLSAKEWGRRHTIFLTEREVAGAGADLMASAVYVNMLDDGRLRPVRNPNPMRCPGCAYREICDTPEDADLIDALFDRLPPKRDREPVFRRAA